ncbi:hypothetical protein AM231_03580 [Paenibacillus solani]|uniref:Uncharacterized protein n=2 Tax=Paenibacillus solani TaxID=1705565 RepID=A0A0M1P1D6_9BACL|nr:hypothetical protein AM231_03580 [Paenibacillus solani]
MFIKWIYRVEELFKEAGMKQENEIQELKDRLNAVEQQLEVSSKGSKLLRTVFIIILVIFLLFTLIGIIQFVSSG